MIEKKKRILYIFLVILVIGILVYLGIPWYTNEVNIQTTTEQDKVTSINARQEGVTGEIVIETNPTETFNYGYNFTNGIFTNNDGLRFENASGGFLRVKDTEGNTIRKVGFGLTSVREDNGNNLNRSVNDFNWAWEFKRFENITYDYTNNIIISDGTIEVVQEEVDKWVATASVPQGDWVQTFDFDKNLDVKITHQIFNEFRNLSQTRLWYMFTVNPGETAIYDGEVYDLDVDRHLTGNLNNKTAKIEFPFESFDFSDILKDYIVTDLFVGNATMFNLPNERIVGIGFATQEGGNRFVVGKNATVDPTITRNVNESVHATVRCEENPYCHLNWTEPNPILYMPFDILNKTSVTYDYSGQDNDGSVGSPVFNTTHGFIGNAYTFNDGSNSGILMGDVQQVDDATTITVMAWVYLESETSDDIIVMKLPSDQSSGLGLFKDEEGAAGLFCDGRTDMFLVFVRETGGGGTFQDLCSASGTADEGVWTHVAFTAETESATGLRLYINGTEVADSPRSTSSIANWDSGGTQLEIGEWITTAPFFGNIDEVMIMERVLSASEIQDIYNNQSARFNHTDTTQLFTNVNFTAGDNRVNVTYNASLFLNTNLSLRLREYEDGTNTANSSWFNLTSGDNNVQNFSITNGTNNITLEFQYEPNNGNMSGGFYTPVLEDNVVVLTWGVDEGAPADPCTPPGDSDWVIDTQNCVIDGTEEDTSGFKTVLDGFNLSLINGGNLTTTGLENNVPGNSRVLWNIGSRIINLVWLIFPHPSGEVLS